MQTNGRATAQNSRATQSFVHTLNQCWYRPSLTLLEIAWRWLFGIPALVLILWQGKSILAQATGGTMLLANLGLDPALLNDPVGALTANPTGAVAKFAGAFAVLLPGIRHTALWLAPTLLLASVVISSLGRTVVLRRADSTLHARPLTLMALQALRLAALGFTLWLWFQALQTAVRIAIQQPMRAGSEPDLVLYCAIVIVSTLTLFSLWATVSWIFSVAPLLAMLHNLGFLPSLRAAFRLGPLKAKLVEINLVLGIVTIALIVLAMVFSATPLPFQSVTTPEFLAWWWAGVSVLYLIASDFFHVARLLGYLALWKTYESVEIV